MQCVNVPELAGHAIQLRWHDINGRTYYIGVCRYNCGENSFRYYFDACSNKITQVKNAQRGSHVDYPFSLGKYYVCQDNCHGLYPNQYETDEYAFDTENKQLVITKFVQDTVKLTGLVDVPIPGINPEIEVGSPRPAFTLTKAAPTDFPTLVASVPSLGACGFPAHCFPSVH